MTVHLALGVAVFRDGGVWWWREVHEGKWYQLSASYGPYETAIEAYKCARKEEEL